jgi:uncharacterized membrane protein YkvA (DUF1232 family)
MTERDDSSSDTQADDPTIDKEFVHDRATRITWKHVAAAGENVATIFNKLEGVPELGPFEEDGKTLVSLIDDFTTGAYRRIPFYDVAVGVAGLLYLIDPVDVIPDFIPEVGYVDDAQVLSISFEMIRDEVDAYREWKNA